MIVACEFLLGRFVLGERPARNECWLCQGSASALMLPGSLCHTSPVAHLACYFKTAHALASSSKWVATTLVQRASVL